MLASPPHFSALGHSPSFSPPTYRSRPIDINTQCACTHTAGYTATDLTAGGGMLTTEEGARTPFAVTQMKNLEEGGHTGRFFRNEAPVVW